MGVLTRGDWIVLTNQKEIYISLFCAGEFIIFVNQHGDSGALVNYEG